jgi:large subunit ribosomal protein L14
VLGSSKKRYAEIGELVILSVQKAEPRKAIKKKDVLQAVVVRQRKPFRRKDGSYIRFDENSVVILTKGTKEPIAGRIFGPIPREIAEAGFQTIASRAPEVV